MCIRDRPGTKGDLAKLALANSITLTPGTVTVSMGPDMLCVYALDPEFGAGIKESAFAEKLKKLEEERHGCCLLYTSSVLPSWTRRSRR